MASGAQLGDLRGWGTEQTGDRFYVVANQETTGGSTRVSVSNYINSVWCHVFPCKKHIWISVTRCIYTMTGFLNGKTIVYTHGRTHALTHTYIHVKQIILLKIIVIKV